MTFKSAQAAEPKNKNCGDDVMAIIDDIQILDDIELEDVVGGHRVKKKVAKKKAKKKVKKRKAKKR